MISIVKTYPKRFGMHDGCSFARPNSPDLHHGIHIKSKDSAQYPSSVSLNFLSLQKAMAVTSVTVHAVLEFQCASEPIIISLEQAFSLAQAGKKTEAFGVIDYSDLVSDDPFSVSEPVVTKPTLQKDLSVYRIMNWDDVSINGGPNPTKASIIRAYPGCVLLVKSPQ